MDANKVPEIAKLVISEILDNFKATADRSNKKSLIITEEDSDRVKTLIRDYDSFKERTKALGIMNRPVSVLNYQKLIYKLIRIAVIHQGFVSRSTLARFKFNSKELIKKITYRNLVEKFVIDNLLGEHYKLMEAAIVEEAKKGKEIDINAISDEFWEINYELKQYAGSGECTPEEESAGWLLWTQIRNRDKSANHKKLAKIENLCYYISFKTQTPASRIIYQDKVRSLSTSNLETIISFICKQINQLNKKAIDAKRKADKRLKSKANYTPKKSKTADQKKAIIKDLKADGKTQSEIARLIGCSERTVRNHWK